jgi:hypothetical protein
MLFLRLKYNIYACFVVKKQDYSTSEKAVSNFYVFFTYRFSFNDWHYFYWIFFCFVIYYLFLLLKDSVAYMHFGKYLLFAQLFVKKIRGTCEVTRTNSLSWAVGARFYRCRLKKRNVPLLNIDNYKRTLIR